MAEKTPSVVSMAGSRETDARDCPETHGTQLVKGKPFTKIQRFSRAEVLARYQQELAYFRADEPYLPIEKSAQRIRMLSALLTAAVTRSCRLNPRTRTRED